MSRPSRTSQKAEQNPSAKPAQPVLVAKTSLIQSKLPTSAAFDPEQNLFAPINPKEA